MGHPVIVQSVAEAKFTQEIQADAHRLVADEPVSFGGDDRGPGPYEYLLAGLGSCTSMTLRMYAAKKGWNLRGVRVELEHTRIHAKDCDDCETKQGMVDEIQTRIHLEGDLDDEQRARLMEIAERCPVHRTLSSEIKIRTQPAD